MAHEFKPSRRLPGAWAAARSGTGKLRRWMTGHGLPAYTVMAYGITWPLLIAAYFGTEAGVLDPGGGLAGMMNQVAAGGPLIAAVVVLALTQGRCGVSGLARSIVGWRVHPLWYAFISAAIPLLGVAATWAFSRGDGCSPGAAHVLAAVVNGFVLA